MNRKLTPKERLLRTLKDKTVDPVPVCCFGCSPQTNAIETMDSIGIYWLEETRSV